MLITMGLSISYLFGQGSQWIRAERLNVGDKIRLADGTSMSIAAIQTVKTNQVVYNFTVDGLHNYHIIKTGVLVHNCDKIDEVMELRASLTNNLPKAQVGSRARSMHAVKDWVRLVRLKRKIKKNKPTYLSALENSRDAIKREIEGLYAKHRDISNITGLRKVLPTFLEAHERLTDIEEVIKFVQKL